MVSLVVLAQEQPLLLAAACAILLPLVLPLRYFARWRRAEAPCQAVAAEGRSTPSADRQQAQELSRRRTRFSDGAEVEPSPSTRSSVQMEQELEDLLESWEAATEAIAARYRSMTKRQSLSTAQPAVLKKAEVLFATVQNRIKLLQRLKSRQTWSPGKEAKMLVNMYVDGRWRLDNLREIVRKIQVENRIVKHWRQTSTIGAVVRGARKLSLMDGEDEMSPGKLDVWAWDGINVFELHKDVSKPLSSVFISFWQETGCAQLCKASHEKVTQFIIGIENLYKDMPYHNHLHAAEVTRAAMFFMSAVSKQARMDSYFKKVDWLVSLVAAAVHDVGHPGVNNDFMVKTRDALALRYNDRSVLENYHAATAFELMKDQQIELLKLDNDQTCPPMAALRLRIVDMILATDMAFHKKLYEELDSELHSQDGLQNVSKLVLEKNLLHQADISHPLLPFPLHMQWAKRVNQEFFAQGDREKALGMTPIALFDRNQAGPMPKGQLGFLNFVIMPSWCLFKKFLHSETADMLDGNFKANLAEWQRRADLGEAGDD